MAAPSSKLCITSPPAPTGPMIWPCSSSSWWWCVKKNLCSKLKNIKAATSVIIRYRDGRPTEEAIDRLSGSTSKKVMPIKAPDEKAKKYCKTPLNLTAPSPPARVDTNVIKASARSIRVIRMHYIGLLTDMSICGRSEGTDCQFPPSFICVLSSRGVIPVREERRGDLS